MHFVLSDADIEGVVLELRAIEHDSAWNRVLQVGRVVFERLVGGDEALWRSRHGKKELSLRQLVRHPACPFKKTALNDCVNVHVFVKRNPRVATMEGVSPSHVMRVVGLPDDAALALLRDTASTGWTVRELQAQVKGVRRGVPCERPLSLSERKAEGCARHALEALKTLHVMRSTLAGSDILSEGESSTLLEALDDIARLVADTRNLPVLSPRSGAVRPLARANAVVDCEQVAL